MSKRKIAQERQEYTTANGRAIYLTPVSPLLLQKLNESFDEEWPEPEHPWYDVEIAGGDKERHLHDDKSAEETGPETVELLNGYRDELRERNAEISRRVMRVIFLKGVDYGEITDDWIAEQEYMGIKVPDNPVGRRMHFIETEVIGSPNDLANIMTEVMAMGGVGRERIDEVKRMFQSRLQGDVDNDGEAG